MDKETLQSMPDYVKNLPKEVQDFVFDGVWEERMDEITLKYSLDENQTDLLINKVLYILIGLEDSENFLESIISELNISRLLATQMLEEIEKRVFEYAVNEIEKNKAIKKIPQPIKSDQQTAVQNNTQETKQIENIPEIRPEIVPELPPEILPITEKGEVVHSNPIPVSTATNTTTNITQRVAPQAPANLPGIEIESTFIGSDFIQKPISVPRYTAEPIPERTASSVPWPAENPSENTINFANNILSKQETKTFTPTPAQTQNPNVAEAPKIPIQKKYVSDPYREPIQ